MIDLPEDPETAAAHAAPEAQGSDTLALADAEARPAVGKRSSALSTALTAFCITLVGFGLFSWMSARRSHPKRPVAAESAQFAAADPPAQLLQLTAETKPAQYAIPGPQFTTSNASPPAPLPGFSLPPIAAGDAVQRRRAPALVVDLGGGGGETVAVVAGTGAAQSPAAAALAKAAAGGAAAADNAQVSGEEKFAERVGGQDAERVRATAMKHLDLLIPQGNVIPAVLETALNSDLPGFTRAVVSRDVRSFDGSTVLIPRGSRLIGQYKSGVALGQTRVFVIWTRVIRPDGVSVQIGSPVTDPLGRGGLDGKVDNHFFTRFGGSILLSVMNAGLTALTTRTTGSQIYIGSPTDASNVASVALQKDSGRAPTITTPQGTAISIFVARDLDFTGVGGQPVR